MCFDKTVCAVFSLIDYADRFAVLIFVNEEFVTDEVHLQDRFLGGHRLHEEGLGTDLEGLLKFLGLILDAAEGPLT